MYLTFYGLKKEPFHTTPDPNFLYLSPTHKEALGAIIYGIEQRKGFIAITGDVGVGKTTIIRAYLERPTTRKQKTIYIFNPVVSFQALLNTIFRSLEVAPTPGDLPDMVTQLHEILIAEYRANSTVVLVIDEAQNMPVETLENLRMLSNLETVSDKLIQIVLIGQPELHDLLDDPKLKALKQRIALRANITPLSEKESQAYIEHRINLVSRTGRPLFTKEAMNLITRQAQGVPRRLNILCDNALITGYGRQRNPVTGKEVKEILADFEAPKAGFLWKWPYVAAIAIAVMIGSLFLVSSFFPSNVGMGESAQGKNAKSSFSAEEQAPDKPLDSRVTPPSSSEALLNGDEALLPQPSEALARITSGGGVEVHPSEPGASLPGVEPEFPSASDQNKNVETLNPSGQSTERAMVPDRRQPVPNSQATDLEANDRDVDVTGLSPPKVGPRTRFVKKGENLSKIAQEIYGSDDPKYVNWVRNHNTGITDPDFILPGQQLILPDYEKE